MQKACRAKARHADLHIGVAKNEPTNQARRLSAPRLRCRRWLRLFSAPPALFASALRSKVNRSAAFSADSPSGFACRLRCNRRLGLFSAPPALFASALRSKVNRSAAFSADSPSGFACRLRCNRRLGLFSAPPALFVSALRSKVNRSAAFSADSPSGFACRLRCNRRLGLFSAPPALFASTRSRGSTSAALRPVGVIKRTAAAIRTRPFIRKGIIVIYISES